MNTGSFGIFTMSKNSKKNNTNFFGKNGTKKVSIVFFTIFFLKMVNIIYYYVEIISIFVEIISTKKEIKKPPRKSQWFLNECKLKSILFLGTPSLKSWTFNETKVTNK